MMTSTSSAELTLKFKGEIVGKIRQDTAQKYHNNESVLFLHFENNKHKSHDDPEFLCINLDPLNDLVAGGISVAFVKRVAELIEYIASCFRNEPQKPKRLLCEDKFTCHDVISFLNEFGILPQEVLDDPYKSIQFVKRTLTFSKIGINILRFQEYELLWMPDMLFEIFKNDISKSISQDHGGINSLVYCFNAETCKEMENNHENLGANIIYVYYHTTEKMGMLAKSLLCSTEGGDVTESNKIAKIVNQVQDRFAKEESLSVNLVSLSDEYDHSFMLKFKSLEMNLNDKKQQLQELSKKNNDENYLQKQIKEDVEVIKRLLKIVFYIFLPLCFLIFLILNFF